MQRNRLIVFVVDDESVIASTLKVILTQNGFDARSFTDPADALQSADAVSPDVLLTDVVMDSVMTGIELALRVRDVCPACKVLLLSGQTITGGLLAAADSKGHHFEILAKPVHPIELLEKIGQLFEG